MAILILQVLLALLGLAATAFAWWMKNDADKKKRIDDEDKKIDSLNGADDIIRESGQLRE